MGVFYYIRAVALLEDLPLEEGGHDSIEDFLGQVEAGYNQVSRHSTIKFLLHPNYRLTRSNLTSSKIC